VPYPVTQIARPQSRPALFSLKSILQSLPVAKKLALIVVVFVAIVSCLLLLTAAQMDILSAVRAYVGGEGLWSKGQKDAVHYLTRYAEFHAEGDYRKYQHAAAVPLGDEQAREELEKPQPDPTAVNAGFIAGRNHPDEVAAMALFFRRYRHLSPMATAIAIWSRADRNMDRVRRLASDLHEEIALHGARPARIGRILERINAINHRITPMEDQFSRTLGEGARWVEGRLLAVTGVVTALLLSIGVLLSWVMLRHIREWEEKYRHLLDTANDAILVADVGTGLILEANRKAEELLGVSASQLVGTHQTDLHPADERERCRQMLDGPTSTTRAASGELHLQRADGRLIPVEVSSGLTELAGKTVVQSIFHDVTERRRAEDALRESEERYRDLFENANDLIYTHDLAGNITSMNRAGERLTGYTRDDVRRMNIAQFLAPDHLARARDMIGRKLTDGGTTLYELDIVAKDGRRMSVEVNTRLILKDRQPVGVQGVARDISARKAAEEALRASRQQLEEEVCVSTAQAQVGRDLISMLETPVLFDRLCQLTTELLGCDSSQTLLWRAAEDAYVPVASYSVSPETGKLVERIRFPREMMSVMFSAEQGDVAVISLPRAASSATPVVQLGMALRRGREIIGVQVATRTGGSDEFSTAQRRIGLGIANVASMALANARLLAELEEASRLKSEFVSTMSHELRTPLNVILGYAEMARDPMIEPTDGRQFLGQIETAGRDLLELIESTLEIGKMEAGRDEVRLEPVQLAELWAAIGQGCANMPRRPDVVLEWGHGAPAVSLVTDPRKLLVVVRNLVGNALKFTERGSVRAEVRLEADTVILRVADTGIGIRQEDQETIFDMFRQADGSDTRRFGGSGLGLYIVRRFVQQLGGTIGLESAPGQRSVFTVALPGSAASETFCAA